MVPELLRTVDPLRVLIVVPLLLLRTRVPLVFGETVLLLRVPDELVRTRVPLLLITLPLVVVRVRVPSVLRMLVPLPVRVRTLLLFTPIPLPLAPPLRVALEYELRAPGKPR